MFISMQKSISSPLFFLRHCNDIANLLVWVLWVCLAMATKKILSAYGNFDVHVLVKNQIYIPDLFLEMLTKYCKFVIFGTLSCLAKATKKIIINLLKNFDVHLHSKNRSDSSFLDILHS